MAQRCAQSLSERCSKPECLLAMTSCRPWLALFAAWRCSSHALCFGLGIATGGGESPAIVNKRSYCAALVPRGREGPARVCALPHCSLVAPVAPTTAAFGTWR